MNAPTTRQLEVMRFIELEITINDNFPTVAEIARYFKVRPNAIHGHLRLIEKKGFIETIGTKKRRTELFKKYLSEGI